MRFTVVCVLMAVSVCCHQVCGDTGDQSDVRTLYQADDVFGPELESRGDREKKAIELKLATGFGVKNFLLDLIFGKVNQVIDYKTRLVSNLDRTNRYKNFYLLGLGTQPKGAAPPSSAGGGGQVSAAVVAEPRAESGILTNNGGLGSALGALTGILGGLNIGVSTT